MNQQQVNFLLEALTYYSQNLPTSQMRQALLVFNINGLDDDEVLGRFNQEVQQTIIALNQGFPYL